MAAATEPLCGLYRCHAGDRLELLQPGARSGEKVVLYVHGWQPGHHGRSGRRGASGRPLATSEGFLTPEDIYGEAVDTAAAWREAGYDVLIFCWAPFADELTPAQAEQKIWDDAGPHRWRADAKSYSMEEAPAQSLGRAFFEAAQGVLGPCQYLHVVGHSLGCQMACRLVELGMSAEGGRAPQRLTLLDPYFTNFGKGYLAGGWTGERVRRIVEAAGQQGAAIEQYKSSAVLDNPLSDANDELLLTTAYIVMKPKFISLQRGPKDFEVLANRHSYAKYCYFRSKGSAPPAQVAFRRPAGPWEPVAGSAGVGHASASDAQIRAMMGGDYHWVQIGGVDSPLPSAHTYERYAGPSPSLLPVRRPSKTQDIEVAEVPANAVAA